MFESIFHLIFFKSKLINCIQKLSLKQFFTKEIRLELTVIELEKNHPLMPFAPLNQIVNEKYLIKSRIPCDNSSEITEFMG